jgi:DNA invertase Pin-like site-specific DNA recombinase
MLIGYIRVSTDDQNLDLQRDAVIKAGCEKIFEDKIGGAKSSRPGLDNLKKILRKGDTLVVWRLDRLGRSLKDLIEWVSYLEKEGMAFKSLMENIDTATASGRLMFHLMGALAEFERNLIRERTMAGLKSARSRGRMGGRPKSLSPEKEKELFRLYDSQVVPVKDICKLLDISKPTLYKYIDRRKLTI